MKMLCLSAYPKGIQDVDDFVSSVEHKRRVLTQTVAVCQLYNGSQWDSRLWEKKNIHRQNQIKTLRLVMIHWGLKTRNNRSVQETEQYLYSFLPLMHRTVQLSWARSQQPARDASSSSSCFTADRRLIRALPPPISQMDYWHSIYNLN